MEAVVAIFILAGGAMACFTLLIQAFLYQGRSQQVTEACMVAETTLESVRQWALAPVHFDSDWAIYAHQDFAFADPPETVAHVEVSALQYEGDVITPAYRTVTVSVSRRNRRVLSLTGQIGSPLRKPVTVRVEAEGPLEVDRDDSLKFQAYLVDASSQVVPGVSFRWTPEPYNNPPQLPGLGTTRALSPQRGALLNVVYGPPPPDPNPGYTPGWVQMRASCRYRGREMFGDSLPVELKP